MGVQISCCIIPKYRRNILYGESRKHLGEICGNRLNSGKAVLRRGI
jgi:REP element-mobilizing transposase RayT